MKKLRLLVDVFRAVRLVVSYLGVDGARRAISQTVTRVGD
jgi:hypothetical protein